MGEESPRQVRKRQVVHVGGFDPVDPDRLNRRMISGLAKMAQLWSIEARADSPEILAHGRIMRWHVRAAGPNWTTETDYTLLRWDELIGFYTARPRWRKVFEGFSALLHFTLNGTVLRYFKASGRYGMFVLYPFFLLIGFALISFYVGRIVAGFDWAPSAWLGVIIGLALFVALLRWVGQYFHLYFALADWHFAADLAHGKVAGLEACLDEFAGEIIRRVRDYSSDEVVLSGVSLGAVMMAEALARALRRDQGLCRCGGKVVFLTIGSSILKVGLHPKATSIKKSVARVACEEILPWIEYQSKVDPINFFKTDPVALMGIPPRGKPIVRSMRIRETMTPEEYRHLRMNFLRLHRQFAMPNSRRYFYDYYLICFGPMSLADRVMLDQRATAAIDEDGCYRPVNPDPGRGKALATTQ